MPLIMPESPLIGAIVDGLLLKVDVSRLSRGKGWGLCPENIIGGQGLIVDRIL
jgi:hypothetical protein